MFNSIGVFFVGLIISLNVWSLTHELDQFYYEESNAISAQQRYASAPSGSWEEDQFRQQRDISIQRALQAINDYSAFKNIYWQHIEQISGNLYQKYNAATSGSALENFYRQASEVAFRAFNSALQEYFLRFVNDWRQIHDFSEQMNQKYSQATSGSLKEKAYDQARRTLYQRLSEEVDREIERMWNFRDIEGHANYFNQKYNEATSGSLKESVYNQIRQSAYNQAINKFSQQAYSLPQSELWQLQSEYNQKYSSATSGSLIENYYRQIRDKARSLIHN